MIQQKPKSVTPWQFFTLFSSQPRGWYPLQGFSVEGIGWSVSFRTLGPEVPFVRMKGDETLDIRTDKYPGPCVEIVINTNQMDCDMAIKVGDVPANILAGLFIAKLSSQVINKRVWSGLMGTRSDGSKFLIGEETLESWRGAPLEKLQRYASELSGFDPKKISELRPAIALACRWFLKGLLEVDRNDRFLSIWLSAVTLYTSWCESGKAPYLAWCKKQPNTNDIERNRIRYYIQNRLNLTGRDEEVFFAVFDDSYNIRIQLVHKGDLDAVTNRVIHRLIKAVGSMLWVELDFPVGGSPAILLTSS
jgi:hypothetical protein